MLYFHFFKFQFKFVEPLIHIYFQVGEGSGIVETPQQKFQRLQHEIRILAEEVNQVKVSFDNIDTIYIWILKPDFIIESLL